MRPVRRVAELGSLGLMSASPKILLFACIAAATANASLPTQADVFSIASFTRTKTNYVSADYIFSALPFYEPVRDSDALTDYPSHKKAATQQGAIVLKDKTVLIFNTRSPRYLGVVDSSSQSVLYRLPKPPSIRRACPKPPPDVDALPFPKPEDVFCVALYPWNHGKHFTPESLIAALPQFRPLTERDIPAKAILASSNTGRFAYPKEWDQAQHEKNPEALNGVLVLKNRAVLKWITWTSTAIAFENYRQNTYFVID
jgi:hypothetical protein